jgi:hypothetical protein
MLMSEGGKGYARGLVLVLAAVLASSCTTVKLKPTADDIVVAREEHVQNCKRLGQTTVRTAEMVAGVSRGTEVVNAELEPPATLQSTPTPTPSSRSTSPGGASRSSTCTAVARDRLNCASEGAPTEGGSDLPAATGYWKISAKKSFMRAQDRASAWASYLRFGMPALPASGFVNPWRTPP